MKLGDGLAVTFSDISEAKATQERYAQLAEFTDSVFQNAPFSIVATDTNGLITAMNVAAEKLTGYSREELVGKAPLTVLHDERELTGQGAQCSILRQRLSGTGFEVLTAGVAAGEMEEQEWTLIRRDGDANSDQPGDAGRDHRRRRGERVCEHRVRHHRAQTDAGLCDASGDTRSTDGACGTRAAAGQDGAGGRTWRGAMGRRLLCS